MFKENTSTTLTIYNLEYRVGKKLKTLVWKNKKKSLVQYLRINIKGSYLGYLPDEWQSDPNSEIRRQQDPDFCYLIYTSTYDVATSIFNFRVNIDFECWTFKFNTYNYKLH